MEDGEEREEDDRDPKKKGGMYNVLKLPNNRKQLVIISLTVMGASDVH
jgi:hypothetical protein